MVFTTGNHLWAERFDKPLADLFDMQDEIVARLANTLDAQLRSVEARRAERAPNPDSMDLYSQGLAWLNKGLTPDNLAQARSFFDRALTADPDNVDALIGSAVADVTEGALLFVTDPIAAFAAAEAKLTKALSSAPDHARGHMWLGLVDILTKRAAEGIAECEHALALDRNLAYAHSTIGLGNLHHIRRVVDPGVDGEFETPDAGDLKRRRKSMQRRKMPHIVAEENGVVVGAPFLGLAIKCASLARIAQTLVETYLGRDAGRRVLTGRIQRGVADRIDTVLWLSDLPDYARVEPTGPYQTRVHTEGQRQTQAAGHLNFAGCRFQRQGRKRAPRRQPAPGRRPARWRRRASPSGRSQCRCTRLAPPVNRQDPKRAARCSSLAVTGDFPAMPHTSRIGAGSESQKTYPLVNRTESAMKIGSEVLAAWGPPRHHFHP